MKMIRVVTSDRSQKIVHDHVDIRDYKIGNLKQWYRGNICRYPIPVPYYDIRANPETLEKERVCLGVSHIKTGYSLPFTLKKADELHKLCLDTPSEYSNGQKTEYLVQKEEMKGPQLVSVSTFKDWRDCEDIDEL